MTGNRYLIPTIFVLLAAITLAPADLMAQHRFTISGYVKEAGSGELLPGAIVYIPSLRTGTTTNNYGFYSITLAEADSLLVQFSYVGCTTEERLVSLRADLELNLEMKPGIMLGEVSVSASARERISSSARMSNISVPVAQIKSVPALLGEKDVLKVIQLMPGVQKGSEGSSGLYVRGGGPDQNLIILDDAIVYNASHLFGFFSLFNGNALKSVELTKGGFPARYGGRLSSVLDMSMKEGNKEEWRGEGGIGLISSNITVEGPLVKEKSSVLVSARRTYVDLILSPILKLTENQNMGYYFYDLNAKANYDFGRKNKLYLSGYFGQDKYYYRDNNEDMKEKVGLLWGNTTTTFRWNHLFTSKLFSNTSLVFSNYKFGVYSVTEYKDNSPDIRAEYYSGIRDLSFKYDLDYIPNPRHWVKTGVTSIYHRFNPYAYVEIDTANYIDRDESKYINGIESAFYIEDTWTPLNSLKLNAGFRLSNFAADNNKYLNLEPRLSLSWRVDEDLALKVSYASMNQYIHLLSNTGINLPTDLWVPTTDRVKPQSSRQVALGLAKDIPSKRLSLSLEGYYKLMNDVIGYKEGASFIDFEEMFFSEEEATWEDKVTSGKAWSYGVELLIQKTEGDFTGWVGYTLSWTQMRFDSLNFGNKFYAKYDRRHDISLVGTYKINNNITVSGTWIYGTGNALTLPISNYIANYPIFHGTNVNPFMEDDEGYYNYGLQVEEYSGKNNYRMGPYHRLDVGIQFRKEKRWGERSWDISVYNTYNRKNPFFYYQTTDSKEGETYGELQQVSLFPIIPSVPYSFKF